MTVEIQSSIPMAWAFCTLPQVIKNDQCDRIYMDFYNLRGAPFSITPDPEFLFLSETHRSVLEKIEYSIRTRMGFILLTGEVGTGKTTLCRALLDHLQSGFQTVYVINPCLSGNELLSGILDDLGISYTPDASKKDLIDRLNQFLLAKEAEKPVVIIVDDAQTMPLATLEDLRLLSNLETDKAKLLQILLVGQPELLDLLSQPQIRQLRQRVTVNCFLDYLTRAEVGGYIERRLFIVGNQGQIRFTAQAVKKIYKKSGGIPRVINKICDLALTAAYTTNSSVVDSSHLNAACNELVELDGNRARLGLLTHARFRTAFKTGAALLAAMMIGFGVHAFLQPGLHPRDGLMPKTGFLNDLAGRQLLQKEKSEKIPDELRQVSSSSNDIRAYILQLGSFNTPATTLRAVDIYSRKGIQAHWSRVDLEDKGIWYRVFVGRYPSIEAARDYQNRADLAGAQILYAPWAVAVGEAGPNESLAEAQRRLQTRGVDSYVMPVQGGLQQLFSGAFVSQDKAEEMARQINQQTGILTRVTAFHSALVSNEPNPSKAATGDPS